MRCMMKLLVILLTIPVYGRLMFLRWVVRVVAGSYVDNISWLKGVAVDIILLEIAMYMS
jgi:hypothetical protein